MIEGGQLSAKNIGSTDENTILNKINEIDLNGFENNSVSKESQVLFQNNCEEINGKITENSEGNESFDASVFEDINIAVRTKKIEKEINGNFTNFFSEKIIITKNIEVKNDTQIAEITIATKGHTKKEAIVNAMAKLAEQREITVTAADEIKNLDHTSINYSEASSSFKTIKINSVKKLSDNTYEVSLSGR